jgi:dTDP-4-dehydrorhamnose 3,5-epimerase
MWVPPGFAHGFLSLSDVVDFLYKTTDYYAPQFERCIAWDDAAISVAWPLTGITPRLSIKDQSGLRLADAPLFEDANGP